MDSVLVLALQHAASAFVHARQGIIATRRPTAGGEPVALPLLLDEGVQTERLPGGPRGADGTASATPTIPFVQLPFGDPGDDLAFLQQTETPEPVAGAPLTIVDLFAGCGGMSIGLVEAARRANRAADIRLAVDSVAAMASVYRRNIPESRVVAATVESLFDGVPGAAATSIERRLADGVGDLEILVGGPPCQGNSDLNNWTRRSDLRNRLYLRMARAAEILEPALLIVENVPAVRHDRSGVVADTRTALEKAGYAVHDEVVDLRHFGVPQRRRRHLLVATRGSDAASLVRNAQSPCEPRTVRWAIEDLIEAADRDDPGPLDRPATPSPVNARRIDYLFDNDVYDLPDAERPVCHQDGAHSYNSVYGRLWWEEPAPTITTGFRCMGQGRYVHPEKRRTLTPHEAARLQSFPDWFDWGSARPTQVATMIGNAVPPLVTLRIGETYLASRSRGSRHEHACATDGGGPGEDVEYATA